MNNLVALTQNRRWLVWVTLGVTALALANSPWFAHIVYACQNQVGGC